MTAGVVLLAAGRSQRFGSDKRHALLPGQLPNQPMATTSVLFNTLQHIHATQLPCFVVLRPGDQKLSEQLEKMGIDWGICPDAHLGMGHSLAFGVRSTQHWDGWLIALADMPWVQPQTYQAIAARLNHANIVRPYILRPDSKKCTGNPVAFSRPFAYQLMQCSGDQGARALLQQHQQLLDEIEVQDEGIIRDIDQPSDIIT